MAYSEAQKRATKKYQKKAYDRLELQIKKGKKDIYRNFAKSKGLSLNAYIIELIENEINKDGTFNGCSN